MMTAFDNILAGIIPVCEKNVEGYPMKRYSERRKMSEVAITCGDLQVSLCLAAVWALQTCLRTIYEREKIPTYKKHIS